MDIESRRRRVHDSFKADLQAIALELFDRRGFDRVSFSDIATAAGISERMVPRYFREKEDILLHGFCESGAGFRGALMATPRTLPPVEAFHRAFSTMPKPDLTMERATTILFHCESSARLRAIIGERRLVWESEVASGIAIWLDCSPASDFRPNFWSSAIYNAVMLVLRTQAGLTGMNGEVGDPATLIKRAFDNLRSVTEPGGKAPGGPGPADKISKLFPGSR